MLEDILQLRIVTTEGMSESESLKLIEQLECAELAQKRFIEGSISFEDYLDILELCEVDIDDYLEIVEENLEGEKILL
ncbi:hypothetical protein [Nostoc sp. PA-18-2419]|uniref:hypothetical protein n=1 Tax=Nostoc sp. PA-18-2419 TaxID=2575443 RepID=UPI0011080A03|nr:hypothetical protein [Nostoc sp. PA-18-2419]